MFRNCLYILLGIALQFFISAYAVYSDNFLVSILLNGALSFGSGMLFGWGVANLFLDWLKKKGKWL